MPSAAEECRKLQGNIREFHIVWRVVTMSTIWPGRCVDVAAGSVLGHCSRHYVGFQLLSVFSCFTDINCTQLQHHDYIYTSQPCDNLWYLRVRCSQLTVFSYNCSALVLSSAGRPSPSWHWQCGTLYLISWDLAVHYQLLRNSWSRRYSVPHSRDNITVALLYLQDRMVLYKSYCYYYYY